MAITGMMGSGTKSHCLHSYASQRKIMPGDIVNTDLCGVYNRYHSNVARCLSLGEPHPDVRRRVDATNQVFSVVAQALKPGALFSQVLEEGIRACDALGLSREEWYFGGYELGVAFPPCWVGSFSYERFTRIDGVTMQPGFVGNWEFNFYLPHAAGIRELIDTFMVTEDAAGFIQQSPIDLIVIE